MQALEAAQRIVVERYPECLCAFLGGSVLRGEATPTSDLDLVIITERPQAPYRESFRAHGWPVEAFVHSPASCRRFYSSDAQRRRPSLPMMCVEGVILRERDGLAASLRREASDLLSAGPPPLSAQEVLDARYGITDLIDDLTGSARPDESLFVAHELAVACVNLLLATHGRWTGAGKWVLRALERFSAESASQLLTALRATYAQEGCEGLVAFADAVLAPHGGRLFEGYRKSAPVATTRERNA